MVTGYRVYLDKNMHTCG